MATTSDYLKQLQADKQVLVDNLVAKGVTATSAETFTTLVPKVNDIQSGGGDLSEYFTETISSGSSSVGGWLNSIKKIPAFKNTGTSCGYMFSESIFSEIDLSEFDTSQVINMEYMFNKCNVLKKIDVSNFDTSQVTNINRMFYSCTNMKELIGINNFDTSKITQLNYVFDNCAYLTNLDLSSWDTSQVTSMTNLFRYCNRLETLDIRNFDFTNVTTYTNTFLGIKADCLIIVKDDTAKEWITSKFTTLTNVKTVAELVS